MTTSTSVERRRRLARRALLSLSTIIAAGAVFPSVAQVITPAPVQQSVDSNGVDLFLGTYNISRHDLTIGDGDLGLDYIRTWRGNSWSDNYDIHVTKSGNRYTVTIGDFAEDFIVQDGAIYSANGGSSIFYSSGSDYYYFTPDRTMYLFSADKAYNTVTNGDVARVTGIYRLNNDTTVFRYNQYSVCVSGSCSTRKNVSRLASVIRNQAFTTELSYAIDTVDDPSQLAEFYRVTAATARNYAVDCDVTSSSCKNSVTSTYGTASATDPESRTDSYQLSGTQITGIRHAGSSSVDTTVTYDASGRVQSVTTPATSTTYGYADDASANERTTTVIDGLNHTRSAVFDLTSHLLKRSTDENGRTTTFIRDSVGRPTKVISPEGSETAGYISYTYDTGGNVTQVAQVAKDGSTPITTSTTFLCRPTKWSASYKDCSRPSTTTDANGGVTNYEYDPNTLALTSITAPSPASGAVRPQTRFIYTYRQPRVKDTSNSLVYGTQTQVLTGISTCRTKVSCAGTADETVITFGRGTTNNGTSSSGANPLAVVAITKAAGDGSVSLSSGRTYDRVGNVVTSVDAGGATTSYTYNNDRQLISTTNADPDGSGPLRPRQTINHYDARGLVDSVSTGTVDASGSFVPSQYDFPAYDAANRKIADRLNDGSTDYALTQYSYDGAGRLECVAQRMNMATLSSLSTPACSPGTSGIDGPDRITKTSFDLAGQVTAVTSAYGTADSTVDASFTYTPNGKISTVSDANGNVTSYAYDGFDRLSRTCYQTTGACTSSASDREEVTYDGGAAGIGTVTSRRLRDGQVLRYDYDLLGRRIYDHNPNTNVAEKDVSYSYDLTGRVLGAGDGNGWSNTTTYDALGRAVTQASNISSTNLQYDAAGRLIQHTWADGFYVTYDYDALGQMTAIHENGGFTLVSFTYDDFGRRTSLTRGNGVVTTYIYDNAGRLQSLLSGGSTSNSYRLAYNAAGQIKSRGSSRDAYVWTESKDQDNKYVPNGLNQYNSLCSTNPCYDGRGNLTELGSDSYQYNTRNQLFMSGAGQLIYRGPTGLLGQTPGINFDWVNGQLAQESSDHVLRRYVYGPGTDEPLVWYEGPGTSDKRYLIADERGSIVDVTDGNGNQITTNTYDEYGIPGAHNQGRFGYTGQIWIPELKMWDYKSRMYAPSLGRFMQTDPIGYDGGMNLYNYVGGDPVNSTDPSGLQACSPGDAFCLQAQLPATASAAEGSSSSRSALPGLSSVVNFLNNLFRGSSKTAAPPQQPAPKPDRAQIMRCPTGSGLSSIGPEPIPGWYALNNAPATVVGGAIAMAEIGIGYKTGHPVSISFGDHSLQVSGVPIGAGMFNPSNGAGITFGNVQLYSGSANPNANCNGYGVTVRCGAHEGVHTEQQGQLGILFLPLYLAHGFASPSNPFERQADCVALKRW